MDVLASFATRLRRYRLLSGVAVLAGMAVASQPSRHALLGMALFGLAGLAWPLLFI